MATFSIQTSVVAKKTIPLRATLSGAPLPTATHIEVATTRESELYAVSVDIEGLEPFAKKGAILLVIPDEEPVPGDDVLVKHAANSPNSGIAYTVCRYVMRCPDQGVVITQTPWGERAEYPLQDVELMDPIHAVQHPTAQRPQRQPDLQDPLAVSAHTPNRSR